MRYGQGLLEEISRRTDIVQLVGRRVKLTRKGRVFWGCCPFHKEKSASFKVENERHTYKCFGCGAGGDVFKWLTETEGLTFPEAVEKLANEAGVELPKWTPEDEAREEKKKSLFDVVEAACVFFEEQLRAQGGGEAREYLRSRGLDEATIKRFRLGFAPGSNSPLIAYLKAKNIPLDDIIAAGLAKAGEEGRAPRDFFFNRVMFPIGDGRGRIIAFGARALEADAKPKYINTGETTLFSKGKLLYNFATARAAALKTGTIIVAEGYMDVIALVRAGFEAAVAPLGTALTEDQLALLWRVAPEPILSFDGDEAGLRAAQRAASLALSGIAPGQSLRFALLPKDEDPDSLIRAHGATEMRGVFERSLSLIQLLWRLETEGKDFSTPERRAGLEAKLREIANRISNSTIRSYYNEGFNKLVFDAFKKFEPKRPSAGTRDQRYLDRQLRTPAGNLRPIVSVLSPVKNSKIAVSAIAVSSTGRHKAQQELTDIPIRKARNAVPPKTAATDGISIVSGQIGVREVKELEIGRLLLDDPEIAVRHAEILAALSFLNPLLDRLRDELLRLAVHSTRLETRRLEDQLGRLGMSEFVRRLRSLQTYNSYGEGEHGHLGENEDVEVRWLRAANQLRELAEVEPNARTTRDR